MNKQEFLKVLRDTLQNQLSPGETENHVEYYRTYIEEQMREGKTEIEILDVLGDPRLIARTILETSSSGNAYQKQEYTYQEDTREAAGGNRGLGKLTARYGHTLRILAGVSIALLVLILVVRVVTFLLPAVLAVAAVLFVFSYFKKR
ncbi:MAG TPA: DUF1700 domain-containing protein [Candidatus Blautia stercoravium]|nr:DUF1700 domain-containing protein [Candidatus Blautia stercoravium]